MKKLLLTLITAGAGLGFLLPTDNDSGRKARVDPQPATQFRETGGASFLSPHAAPIAALGSHLFVVNTPSDTVDVIDCDSRTVQHRIAVGVDPVSIAVRPDGKEVWVSNHVSDSVSVIDSDPQSPTYLHVVATVQEFDRESKSTKFDEPVGIAFASNDKVYVALSSTNQIAVIDVASRKVTRRLKVRSQEPRHIVVRNNKLFVIPFESNNKTQLSGGNKDDIDGELVTFDAWEHSIVHNNVLSLGHVVDIVKHPDVPDRDLFIFDTETDELIETVDTLGTLLYGLTVGKSGNVFIAQTDARNDINGRAGTKDHSLKELENRPFLNRITKVSGFDQAEPQIDFFDLEPLPPQQPDPEDGIATPFAIAMTNDESTLFVTAAGSDKLVSVDATSGEILGDVGVGSVPRGIVFDSESDSAWVFNTGDNSVLLVNVADARQQRFAGQCRRPWQTQAKGDH